MKAYARYASHRTVLEIQALGFGVGSPFLAAWILNREVSGHSARL